MAGSAPILQTRALCKSFGALKAVDEVDFSLDAGELRAIIGPNGAGKSTFFNMLAGGLPPTSGEIFALGHDVTKAPPHKVARHGVSLAFQITNIFPKLTVADNLRLAAQSRDMSFNPLRLASSRDEIEQLIEQVLDEIALTPKRDEAAANLSHGEQKYLEIGIALATNPKLLLLDEPTAGMSAEETHATAGLIKTLSQRLSVILVEHDMDVVMSIADTVTVFHHGTILAQGTPDEIRSDSEVQRVYLRGADAPA